MAMKDSRIFARPNTHPARRRDYLSPEARALVEALRANGPIEGVGRDGLRRGVLVGNTAYSAKAVRECRKKGAARWTPWLGFRYQGAFALGWRESEEGE
jgi:hypothetical protein